MIRKRRTSRSRSGRRRSRTGRKRRRSRRRSRRKISRGRRRLRKDSIGSIVRGKGASGAGRT